MGSNFKVPRWESKAYLDFIRGHGCVAPTCEQQVSEPHHWHETEKGTARKPSDCWTVPLCHGHHIHHWHFNGTLPGLTNAECRELFASTQRVLMAKWISRGDAF